MKLAVEWDIVNQGYKFCLTDGVKYSDILIKGELNITNIQHLIDWINKYGI